jgi:hypothetical protein
VGREAAVLRCGDHPRSLSAGGNTAPEYELTQVGGGNDTGIVSGSGSRRERSDLKDRDLVESVLRELNEAADKWEALVAQAETITYSVDLGDIHAVANSDGRLLKLALHRGVMTGYSHGELADRLNLAIAALREEAEAENQARYGGHLK